MHAAGVLDYTAVEGTVGVPPLVSRNLFDAELPPAGAAVAVTYCKLPKGAKTACFSAKKFPWLHLLAADQPRPRVSSAFTNSQCKLGTQLSMCTCCLAQTFLPDS